MSLPRTPIPAAELEAMVACGKKRFVKRGEGEKLYSLGRHSFEKLAKEAHASLHYSGSHLYDCQKIDEYLQFFYDED